MATSAKSAKKSSVAKQPSTAIKYLLIVVALLLYGKTIEYEFVLDDDLFIKNHPAVQAGIKTIPSDFVHGSMEHFKGSNFQIYRPATVSLFTVEKSLFGNSPKPFHLVNIVLYALILLVIFDLILLIAPGCHSIYAFLLATLYAVHPVHSEVVANIKSQDELLASLLCLMSLRYFIRYLEDTDRKSLLSASLLTFLFALFSKESSAAFFAVFPMTAFLLRGQTLITSMKKVLPYVVPVLFFLAMRHIALKDLKQDNETTVIENVLYGADTFAASSATKATILWFYLKLMIWPNPLSWDYSFNQIPVVSWEAVTSWLSVIGYLLLLASAVLNFKKRPVITWGLLFFLGLILPTSNLFFLNGTTFAERFLFLPSFGAIVALLPLVTLLSPQGWKALPVRATSKLYLPFLVVVLICFVQTTSRCSDWKDNFTLFESGVRNAPNSARAQAGLATEYMNKAEKSQVMAQRQEYIKMSIEGFKRTLEIFPEHANSAYKLGLIHAIIGDTTSAISYYRRALVYRPADIYSLNNLGTVYAARQQFDSALTCFQSSFATDSLQEMTLANLGVVNFNTGNDSAVIALEAFAQRNKIDSQKLRGLATSSRQRMELSR